MNRLKCAVLAVARYLIGPSFGIVSTCFYGFICARDPSILDVVIWGGVSVAEGIVWRLVRLR